MMNPLDIAWLAGIFDGEGCVYVQRSRRKGDRIVSSIGILLANTSTALLDKYIAVLSTLGITPKVNMETRYGTRPICYVKVARKQEALLLARTIVEYTTAKQTELRLAIWYLSRAVQSRQHVATDQDREVLKAITGAKHGVEIPASVKRLIDSTN